MWALIANEGVDEFEYRTGAASNSTSSRRMDAVALRGWSEKGLAIAVVLDGPGDDSSAEVAFWCQHVEYGSVHVLLPDQGTTVAKLQSYLHAMTGLGLALRHSEPFRGILRPFLGQHSGSDPEVGFVRNGVLRLHDRGRSLQAEYRRSICGTCELKNICPGPRYVTYGNEMSLSHYESTIELDCALRKTLLTILSDGSTKPQEDRPPERRGLWTAFVHPRSLSDAFPPQSQ